LIQSSPEASSSVDFINLQRMWNADRASMSAEDKQRYLLELRSRRSR